MVWFQATFTNHVQWFADFQSHHGLISSRGTCRWSFEYGSFNPIMVWFQASLLLHSLRSLSPFQSHHGLISRRSQSEVPHATVSFQSHHGLISSLNGADLSGADLAFNPIMVWFQVCLVQPRWGVLKSFQSHHGLISSSPRGQKMVSVITFQSHHGLISRRYCRW